MTQMNASHFQLKQQKQSITKILCNVFKIAVTMMILILIIFSILWYLISINNQTLHSQQHDLRQITQRDLYFLPVDTEIILLSHDDTKTISNDENEILSEIFDLFDINQDNLLDLREYKHLVNVTIKPDDQFNKMKSISSDYLKYNDLLSFFITLDVTNLYKHNNLKELVFKIFNYSFNNQTVDVQYYKYLTNIFFYILDKNNDCLISSQEYISYIITREWNHSYNYHTYDTMNFSQFSTTTFNSIYYLNYKRSQLSYIANQNKFDQILMNNILNYNHFKINYGQNCHKNDNIITSKKFISSIDDVIFIQLPHPLHFMRSTFLLTQHNNKRRLQSSECGISLLDHGSDCTNHSQCCSQYCLKTCNANGNEQRKCHCSFKDAECMRDDECCSYSCINAKCTCSNGGDLCHLSNFMHCCKVGTLGNCVTTDDGDWTQWRCETDPTYSPTPQPTDATYLPTLSPTPQTGNPTHLPTSSPTTNGATVAPTDSLKPTDSPTYRPTAKPTPRPTPKPITPTMPTLTPITSSSCFSENSMVLRKNNISTKMKNIHVGDYIFDGTKHTKVIAIRKAHTKIQMITLYLFKYDILTMNSITLTEHHLLYSSNNSLISAGNFVIGDQLYDNFTIHNILVSMEYPCNVVTMSGYLRVNGIKSSCYVENEKFAKGIHSFSAVFRWTSEYVSEYYTNQILQFLIPESGNVYRWIFKDSQYEWIFVDNQVIFLFTALISTIVIAGKHIIATIMIAFHQFN
eukprot:170951_1